ncbi:hypothetical protein FACS1894202_08910 [Clostridia bacterium]|nr:hypothetical protein FACS1894202_08910 [Clostridia bacterium]
MRITSWVNGRSEVSITTKAGLLISPEPFYPFVKTNNYVVNWGYYDAFKLFEARICGDNELVSKLKTKQGNAIAWNAAKVIGILAVQNLPIISATRGTSSLGVTLMRNGNLISGLQVLSGPAGQIMLSDPFSPGFAVYKVSEAIKDYNDSDRTILAVDAALALLLQSKYYYILPNTNNGKITATNMSSARDEARKTAEFYEKYPTYTSYIEPLKALVSLSEKDLQRYGNKYYEKSKFRNGVKDAQYYHAYAELLNEVVLAKKNRTTYISEAKAITSGVFTAFELKL